MSDITDITAMTDSPERPLKAWLLDLPEGSADGNPDLEYEPEFLALAQAVLGRPETQFSAAEPPSWPLAQELAEALMQRTRDLRVAMSWGRAVVNLGGLSALPAAVALLHGLLENCWDTLNPRPEAGDDAFVRLAALSGIDTAHGLAGDLRQAALVTDRRLMGLTVRDCEIALDLRSPRTDEVRHTPAQIAGLLADAADAAEKLAGAVAASLQGLQALDSIFLRRFGTLDPPETVQLRGMLAAVQRLLPVGAAPAPAGRGSAVPPEALPPVRVHSGPDRIESRQDVLRAIDLACAYLDRHEPTNPAQWLLRRAAQLIGMDFVQLVRMLAPEAAAEVQRLFGVGPDGADGLADTDAGQ